MEAAQVLGAILAALLGLVNLVGLWFLTRIFAQYDLLQKNDAEHTKELAGLRVELARNHYTKSEVNTIVHTLDERLRELIELLRPKA